MSIGIIGAGGLGPGVIVHRPGAARGLHDHLQRYADPNFKKNVSDYMLRSPAEWSGMLSVTRWKIDSSEA